MGNLDSRYELENCFGIEKMDSSVHRDGILRIHFNVRENGKTVHLWVNERALIKIDEYSPRQRKCIFLCLMAYPDFFID